MHDANMKTRYGVTLILLLVNDNHLSRSGAGVQYQFPEYVRFWELA